MFLWFIWGRKCFPFSRKMVKGRKFNFLRPTLIRCYKSDIVRQPWRFLVLVVTKAQVIESKTVGKGNSMLWWSKGKYLLANIFIRLNDMLVLIKKWQYSLNSILLLYNATHYQSKSNGDKFTNNNYLSIKREINGIDQIPYIFWIFSMYNSPFNPPSAYS